MSHEIEPQLAQEVCYVASERTMYRILKQHSQLHHHSKSGVRQRRTKSPQRTATGCDQVYTWHITWMPSDVKGIFFYAYVVMDIFDKSIVGWEIHQDEDEHHSRALFSRLLRRTVVSPQGRAFRQWAPQVGRHADGVAGQLEGQRLAQPPPYEQ